jgi:hypothetical protein
MQCLLYKIYFWKVFHMYCNLVCILYALLCGQNFIHVKSGCYKLHSVTPPELKCLFAMVNWIKYTIVADIVDYFKNVHKMSGPIECTFMVTRIAMNLGCPEMANLAYIEGDAPDLGLEHFCSCAYLAQGTRSFFIYVVWSQDDSVT